MRLALALLLSLAVSPAYADHVLVKTKAGFYVLDQDADGTPHLHKIEHVVDLTDQPTPPPNPVLKPRSVAIRDLAAKVTDKDRERTAAMLSLLYDEIAARVRKGELTGRDISTVASEGANKILAMQDAKAAWQPVRDKLSEFWTTIAQNGGADTEYATLLDEAADGLDASIAKMTGIDWETLRKIIIAIIIDLLSRLAKEVPIR